MLHLTNETSLMKKINLSIPKPCHENWNAMTPSEKGKFCGSCQKTVIDFTEMSDRQIAEFFKKPPSSVCGRVYNDQLHRDIVIPRKRMPWLKYFFQFTWPAFLILLKSCGSKESVSGDIKVEFKASQPRTDYATGIVGMLIPQITPAPDKMKTSKTEQTEELVTKGEMMGDISDASLPDTVAMSVDTLVQTQQLRNIPDTIIFAEDDSTARIMVGGISVCNVESINEEQASGQKENPAFEEIKFKVYPNPVRAGSMLTISSANGDALTQRIQLLSSSGQLISDIKQNGKDSNAVVKINIPWISAPGVYFLHMISNNGVVATTKVIVIK
jgi:hypothetical protein